MKENSQLTVEQKKMVEKIMEENNRQLKVDKMMQTAKSKSNSK